jgi:hypothetical protein
VRGGLGDVGSGSVRRGTGTFAATLTHENLRTLRDVLREHQRIVVAGPILTTRSL